jgi:hypothetical protein
MHRFGLQGTNPSVEFTWRYHFVGIERFTFRPASGSGETESLVGVTPRP